MFRGSVLKPGPVVHIIVKITTSVTTSNLLITISPGKYTVIFVEKILESFA